MIKINEKHDVSSKQSKLNRRVNCFCKVLDRLVKVIELNNVKYRAILPILFFKLNLPIKNKLME